MKTQIRISEFVLSNWGAWAPGMNTKEDWAVWCAGIQLNKSEQRDALQRVPKMLQRRLSPLARAAFYSLEQCVSEGEKLPAVFSSAHGEIGRSLEMLKMIDAGEEVSPTSFSLSVHNAISGLYSIAYDNQQEMTVIAPGFEGIAAGFIEALGLLQEGANAVALVLYDEPIPDFYPVSPFNLNAAFPCALTLKLTLKGKGLPMSLCRLPESREDGEHPVQLLAFIKFLASEEKTLILGNQGHSWRWDKI